MCIIIILFAEILRGSHNNKKNTVMIIFWRGITLNDDGETPIIFSDNGNQAGLAQWGGLLRITECRE